MRVRTKFLLSTFLAIYWLIFSILLAEPWSEDLSKFVGSIFAWVIIGGIALFPGFMNAFLLSSLILDKRPARESLDQYPAITILIAAFNEETSIESTLSSIAKQDYRGHVRTVILNDGSTDETRLRVYEFMADHPNMDIDLVDIMPNEGKSFALNLGLKEYTDTALVITIDGDCYLYTDALKNIVERMVSDPDDTVAVAGCVLVRNSRFNLLTKAQEWDYFHGISAIKRIQSMYHGTLVAQGAFSIYKADVLKKLGGWSNTVGEDIVLSWDMLKHGYRIGYAEDAYAFTNVPTTWKQFIKQRQRWGRGLIEAFKAHYGLLWKKRFSTMFIWWNLTFPYLDLSYTLFFIPGLIAALFFQLYYIVGLLTLLLLPLSLLLNLSMFLKHTPTFNENGMKVRKNYLGFLFYSLFYSIILQPACVWGYIKEIFDGAKKNWGTK